MLTLDSHLSIRRLFYWIFLGLSLLAPIVVGLTNAGAISKQLEAILFSAGFVGFALLFIWCAVYVHDEPRLVRIALIWIASLFLFVIVAIASHPYVH